MGQRNAGLRHADEAHRLVRCDCDLQGGRVRGSDVLGGDDDQAPGDEPGVLPSFEHPREVMQRGIRIGATHGLDKRAGDVVVLVAVAVVAGHRLIRGASDVSDRDRGSLVAGLILLEDVLGDGLEVSQAASSISARDRGELVQGVVSDLHLAG